MTNIEFCIECDYKDEYMRIKYEHEVDFWSNMNIEKNHIFVKSVLIMFEIKL